MMSQLRRDARKRFRRAKGVEVREVGREIFVVAPGDGGIHQLDATASAAWRALSEPKSLDELTALFQAAFPDAPKRRIATDIENLIAFLRKRRLVVTIDRK
jgi:coenzyme PQQ synthesis protein D (PqqD)